MPFLLSFMKIEKSIGLAQIFDFRFLMDLYVLGSTEHDLTISEKCLSVYDRYFVASAAQELMHRIL